MTLGRKYRLKMHLNSRRISLIKFVHGLINYCISCSDPRKRAEWKKSLISVSRPSQSFLMVETVTLLLRPLTMLFTVDCVTPLMEQSLLTDRFRSTHNSKMRSFAAVPIVIGHHILEREYPILLEKFNSKELSEV